ncbi:hypothetical protein GJ744_000301 [Endocarpon pusillum]|uniref:Uncharacterized protein n=1 Tax=Endocarpon pusillum TaxID=364733 RepID=A0A8H7ASI5_9EURO|nr:hypothetical protein GJ744_000301 [Endocarpon pusillum]
MSDVHFTLNKFNSLIVHAAPELAQCSLLFAVKAPEVAAQSPFWINYQDGGCNPKAVCDCGNTGSLKERS